MCKPGEPCPTATDRDEPTDAEIDEMEQRSRVLAEKLSGPIFATLHETVTNMPDSDLQDDALIPALVMVGAAIIAQAPGQMVLNSPTSGHLLETVLDGVPSLIGFAEGEVKDKVAQAVAAAIKRREVLRKAAKDAREANPDITAADMAEHLNQTLRATPGGELTQVRVRERTDA